MLIYIYYITILSYLPEGLNFGKTNPIRFFSELIFGIGRLINSVSGIRGIKSSAKCSIFNDFQIVNGRITYKIHQHSDPWHSDFQHRKIVINIMSRRIIITKIF